MNVQRTIAKLALATMVFTAFFTIAITPWIVEKTSPEMGVYTGAISGFALFILILEVKTIRFAKGMLLIAFGVLFQVLYPKYYFFIIKQDPLKVESLAIQLELYMQVLLFACAGAGGSIIANYADKSSSDYEQNPSSSAFIDNTENIDHLRDSANKIERRVNLTIAISLLSLITTLIIAVASLFK